MATAHGGNGDGGLSPSSCSQQLERRSIEDLLAGEDLSFMDDSSSSSQNGLDDSTAVFDNSATLVRRADDLDEFDSADAAADVAWRHHQYQQQQHHQLFTNIIGQHVKPDSSLLLERLLSDQPNCASGAVVNGGSGGSNNSNRSPVIQRKLIDPNWASAGANADQLDQAPDVDIVVDDTDDDVDDRDNKEEQRPDNRLQQLSLRHDDNDAGGGLRSPPDGGSDTESLPESIYHQPPKAADREAAARLARRLYLLEGFKFTDVAKHLSRKNDFNTIVGEEYANNFDFVGDTLDAALRKFLSRFCLLGDTADQERVLLHFAKSYLRCNPDSYPTADSCHTLACALLLLNKDLHGMTGQRMTSQQFIDNLANLNEGDNYPREVLKSLYQAIRAQPILQPASGPIVPQHLLMQQPQQQPQQQPNIVASNGGGICVLRPTPQHAAYNGPSAGLSLDSAGSSPNQLQQHSDQQGPGFEFRRGQLSRKQILDAGGRRTRKGRRAWRRLYGVLADLRLSLHKDEAAAVAAAASLDSSSTSTPAAAVEELRVHHALASPASDYAKRRHVWRLRLANGAEYLIQCQSAEDLNEWVLAVNRAAALMSSPALPPPVGSQPASAYARPLLPSVPSHFGAVEQLERHQEQVLQIERELQFLSPSGSNSNIASSGNANGDNSNVASSNSSSSPPAADSAANNNNSSGGSASSPSPAILRRQNSTGSSSGSSSSSSATAPSGIERQRHVTFLQNELVRYKTYVRLLESMTVTASDFYQQHQQQQQKHYQQQQQQLQQLQMQQMHLQQLQQLHQLQLPVTSVAATSAAAPTIKMIQSPLLEDSSTSSASSSSAATTTMTVTSTTNSPDPQSPTFGTSGAFKPPSASSAQASSGTTADLYEIV